MVITKSFDEPLLTNVICEACPCSFWGETDPEKCMLKITGLTSNCATWLKETNGVIGARVLTVNGETAIGHDFEELSHLLNDASLPAAVELELVHDAEIKKDKIGRKDDNEEQEEIELGGQDGKNNSEKQENESEENNTPTSVTLCEGPDGIYT